MAINNDFSFVANAVDPCRRNEILLKKISQWTKGVGEVIGIFQIEINALKLFIQKLSKVLLFPSLKFNWTHIWHINHTIELTGWCFSIFCRYSDGTVKLRNPNIELMDQDILYHLALGSGSHDLVEMFGDVKVRPTE